MIAESTVSLSLFVCTCMCVWLCDSVNMKRSFIATVYTGGLCKINIAATNPNNPAPKMHEKLPILCKRKRPLSARWNTKSKNGSAALALMFKGHLADQRGPN